MNDDQGLIPDPEHIAAIREALTAAREGLKASIKQNDQLGIAKLTRVVGELGSRLARSGLIEKQKLEDEHQRNAIIQDIVALIEAPILDYEDLQKRKHTLESVRLGEARRQEMFGTQGLDREGSNQADSAPELGSEGLYNSSDAEG